MKGPDFFSNEKTKYPLTNFNQGSLAKEFFSLKRITGEGAKHMETLSEDQVKNDLMTRLKEFKPDLPDPIKMIPNIPLRKILHEIKAELGRFLNCAFLK